MSRHRTFTAPFRASCTAFALVAFAFSWGAPFANADDVVIGSAPGRPAKVGFNMTIRIESVGGFGYQPMHLDFMSLGKQFTRDRNLEVELSPRGNNGTELDFGVRHALTLPEGVKSKRFTLMMPHYYQWDQLRVKIYEEGRLVPTGSMSLGIGGLRTRHTNQLSSVGLLTARNVKEPWGKFPDVRTLVTSLGEGPLPTDAGRKRLDDAQSRNVASQVQPAWVQFRILEAKSLPDKWLAHSQLDIILVPEPLLARIETHQPEEFAAIRQWLAAGGNLWIYAASDPTCSLITESKLSTPTPKQVLPVAQVNRSLNLSGKNDTSDLTYEYWSGIQKESQNYSSRSRFRNLPQRGKVFTDLKKAKHPFADNRPSAELASELHVAPYGLGQITTIQANDPFPGSFQFWNSVTQRLHKSAQIHWVDRNGIDITAGNDNYWRWLIPSVGQPPVKSFVFLNTLFVLIVGPLCYFLFRRHGRLYLLYFFAPALAFLVTFSLFVYALSADGIHTQARIRQITWLDSRHDFAVDQSRQTYYAVFAGSDGLRFSNDTAVYPVRNSPADNPYYRRSNRGRGGEIVIGTDSTQYRGTFLPPRAQVQYLVTHPRPSRENIKIDWSVSTPVASNGLRSSLERLIACAPDGLLWQTENVGPGETATLVRANIEDLGEMLDESVLPPLGPVPELQNNRGRSGRIAGTQMSALETKLEFWSRNLPVKSFVAVGKVDDDELAAENAIAVGGVHVWMGRTP